MSKVSITQAAKLAKISRSTLYNKYIKPGVISVETIDDKKLIDVAELIRVFGNVQLDNQIIQNDTPYYATNTADKDKLILTLEKQLTEAKEREDWLKQQLENTTHLLENKMPKKRKKFLGIF